MPDEERATPATINFDYLKSSQFRIIHADGAFFALTGQGGLTISFFAERQPIPRRVVHKINADGNVGEEITEQRVVRDAIIRDTEIAVVMSADTAKRLRAALDDVLKRSDAIFQNSEQRK